MLKKRLFLTLLSTFLIVIISIGISFAWYTNKKVDDFESPDVTGYSTAAYYAGGNGTKENPFIIKNSRHLYNFAWLQYLGTYNKIENGAVKQYYFEIADDIEYLDCDDLVIPPIGTTTNPFLGNFNGNGKTIKNFTVTNNFNDLKKKPSSISSPSKFTGCDIIGFFGVVGKYADYLNVNISSQVNSVYDFNIDGVKINNACTNTLAGLIAGFVNGNISNVGVHYGKINLQAATSKISSFKNISSYTLIGDYDEALVSWEDKPSSENSSGSGADFGGTLNFPEIYQRMTYMDKYGYKDIWGSGNNRIYLDNTVTYKDNTDEVVVTTSHIYDNNYMPLVLENFKEDNYKKLAEETPLNTNIGYYVGGTGAVIEKIKVGEILEEPTNGTSAAYTLDASGNKTGVRLYTFDGNSHEEVTSIVDKSIRDILFDFTKNEYLYGIRFTSQIEIQNKKTTLNNSVFNGETVNNLIVPTNSIYFKASQTGIAKIIAYKTSGKDYNGDDVADTPNTTRALTLYRIFDGSYGRSQEIVKDAAYRNNVDWEDAFYYFEYPIVKGEEYAIGSSNGSDNAHFIYLDIGQNAGAGAPSVKPEIKDFAIEGIDFVYLNYKNNTFSSTSDDYSNVFFQISGTTDEETDYYFRRNNDGDDNYSGNEGIVLFYPTNKSGKWTDKTGGKTDGKTSLDWSYAGTKGLSGTSDKYTKPELCEVLDGMPVKDGLANTNTGVNTKRTITYYYRRKKEDGTYESVLITKGTVTNGYAITKPDFEVTGYVLGEKWYTDEALTQEYDFSKAVTENLVLYATATEVETFTVTFMDGENELQTLVVNSGSYASPAIPRKEGYVFSHWEDSTGATVDLKNTAITADLILKAKWEDAHDIKFVYNIGADDVLISTLEVIDDDQTKITKPEDPTLDGYNFAGWYTTKDYTTEFNFDEVPSGDTTIYAKFVAIQYYDVVFGYMDGETLVTLLQEKVEEKTSVAQPIDPTRVGYVFGGWYSDSICETEFDFSSEITANTTVYAKWQASLVVSFEYEDGTPIESISVLSGNTITAISIVPSKDGYRYDGNWYVKASDGTISGTAFDFANPIEANTTLVPGWIKTYEVTYVYNNDTQNTIETVDIGIVLTQPEDPTRTGYKFNGWYTLAQDETKTYYDFSSKITSDITIYADWVELVNVTLIIGDSTDVIYGESGDTITLPSTNDDYYIISWTDGTTTYQPGDQVTVTTTTTYTAEVVNKYTVTVNDGTTTTTLVNDVNGKVTLPDEPESSTTATFAGWTDGTTTYSAGQEITVNSDMTITATWTYVTSVTFDANGGTIGSDATVFVENIQSTAGIVDISKIPADPTREGYTFQGWYIDSACTIELDTSKPITVSTIYAGWKKTIVETVTITVYVISNISNPNNVMIETQITISQSYNTTDAYNAIYEGLCEYSDNNPSSHNYYNYELVTVYEHDSWFATAISDTYLANNNGFVAGEWYAVHVQEKQGENYTVEFNSNGGSTVANQTVLEGRTVSKPTDPTRDGYIFSGWYSDSSLTTEYNFSTPISDNITLYAKWIEQKTVTINYVEGGNTITEYIKVAAGESITLPSDVTNEYYITSITSGDNQYNEGSSLEVEDNITLTVNKVTIYQVTIDYGNGTTEALYTNENYLVSPSNQNPTNGTAELVGWYVGNTAINFETYVIKSSGITIAAKWEYNVTVTFSVDGSTYHEEITTTGYITLPENPSKEGYIFLGWYNGSEKIDGSIIFSVDTTVTAEWQEIYTITFVYNDNSTTDLVLDTNEDCKITNFPANPTRDGYIFLGWYAAGEQVTSNTTFDVDTRVEAQWVETYTITFDANGGTHTASTTTAITNAEGKLSSLPSNPTLDGYAFVEWNTVSDGTGNTVTTDIVFESDTTVYAVWKEQNGFKITLNLNGGNISGDSSNIEIIANGDGTVDLSQYVPTGSSPFGGWYDEDNYYITEGYAFTEDTEIKAAYGIICTYNLYLANSSNSASSEVVYTVQGINGYSIRYSDIIAEIEKKTGREVEGLYRYGGSYDVNQVLTFNQYYMDESICVKFSNS